MIRRPPRSTLDRSSAASDVYKRQRIKNRINLLEAAKDQFLLNAINNGVNLNAYKDASDKIDYCLLYTSPSPRDRTRYRMPSSA